MLVQPNCAYIIPPNRDMAFLNGTLQLMEPSAPRDQRLPIDFFFHSLAQDQGERAICIVLSGTGSDGTLGVRAIKGEGGMAMAQNPASTEYDGMPRSAIATGFVDYQLPPAEMPAQLIAYVAQAFGRPFRSVSPPTPKAENALKEIFVLLRAQTSHDFSLYKLSTIQRRIERRMAVNQIATADGYVKYLQQTPGEVEALFRDLLIGVTNFFRDPEAFKALEEQVIPQLFAGKPANATIRVWVPGCSSGEEAYSIAILLAERQQDLKQSFITQVFATEIDSQAIATARAGLYPASIAADLSPERLARFFAVESGGSFRIHKAIREMLVFSEQDVIKDPPFSKLDLISCRNLLIYMGGELQKKIIPLFHYALNPAGFLFLGTSETVGEFLNLYAVLDRKQKLYQRKEDFLNHQQPEIGRILPPSRRLMRPVPGVWARAARVPPLPNRIPVRELTEQALLRQAVPAAALVNAQGDILYLHGRTGMFLEPAPGEAGVSNILKMAREGLRRDLVTALHKAAATQELVYSPGLRVKTNGDFSTVNLTVQPVAVSASGGQTPDNLARPPVGDAPLSPNTGILFLVILELAPTFEREPPQPADSQGAAASPELNLGNEKDALINALKQELRAKEEYLQSTNEELETANEELKSSNEEMQSVNEELSTVNSELQTKVADLSRANNDMNNLLAGTGIATLFVDHRQHILRFTPSATRVINLIMSDVGRPVNHIVSNLVGYNHLTADIQSVLDSLVSKEVEVQTSTGEWYMMRIQPYRTLDNVIEGAVLTFVDISEMKRAGEALRKANDLLRLAVVVRDSVDAILVQDLEGRILAWNPGAERMYGWSEAEALKLNIRDLIPESMRQEALGVVSNGLVGRKFWNRIARSGSPKTAAWWQ